MVVNLMASGEFSVMVNATLRDGFTNRLQLKSQLTFSDAADYVIQAQGYFTYAILDHEDWSSVNIEVGDRNGSIQIIEIRR